MSLVNVSSLDFNDIRESIKSFLRADGRFTDYDFEGSNFRVLLDTLAYNTYISSYNANMLTNEVFLDGATLRENVVSIARNIGYLPRSVRCSKARVSFYVDLTEYDQNPISVVVKKGIIASSSDGSLLNSFVYSIPDDIRSRVSGKLAEFKDVDIFEGNYIEETFTVDSLSKNQRFILSNNNIDTNTIRVTVRDSKTSSNSIIYKFADNITNVKSSDKVFFINEIEDSKYELIFGDGTFGSALSDKNFIIVSYIKTKGELANGVRSFEFNGILTDNNGNPLNIDVPILTTIEFSDYGSPIESISSIKKFAPRLYASQNRAVTASDYETIVPLIYPETESVAVFGGEELNPPQYGKVFITVKPRNGTYLSNLLKDSLKQKLKKYSVAGIIPEFIDLKYLYIEYNSSVYYNINRGYANTIKDKIQNNLELYSKSKELNSYGSRFKYSKFLKLIDDTSESITSNITKISIRRDLKITEGTTTQYEICFGNSFYIKRKTGYNIKSSGFTVSDISGVVYLADKPIDDVNGDLFIFQLQSKNSPVVVKNKVGNINYKTGEINLNYLNIISTTKLNVAGDKIIEISATPESNDVIGKQDLYLQLDTTSSTVNLINDTISSGTDLSGSGYIVTSSYLNEDLVRI